MKRFRIKPYTIANFYNDRIDSKSLWIINSIAKML